MGPAAEVAGNLNALLFTLVGWASQGLLGFRRNPKYVSSTRIQGLSNTTPGSYPPGNPGAYVNCNTAEWAVGVVVSEVRPTPDPLVVRRSSIRQVFPTRALSGPSLSTVNPAGSFGQPSRGDDRSTGAVSVVPLGVHTGTAGVSHPVIGRITNRTQPNSLTRHSTGLPWRVGCAPAEA